MKASKVIFAVLALVMIAMPLFAAGGSQAGGQAGGALGPGITGRGRTNYPINTNATITYWLEPNQNNTTRWTNFGDTPYNQERHRRTGINVQYLQPPVGAGSEQANLIIASRDFPDIMERNWLTNPGGPERAIDDNVILRLNDIIDNWGPYLREYLDKNPEFDRSVRSDEGSYYVFPYLRGDLSLLITNAPQMRKDWLDQLGFAIPQTIDDWHAILVAFRDRLNVPAPFTMSALTLWDRIPFFYTYGEWPRGFRRLESDTSRIVFSPIQDGYRQALTLMANWYREGLIDRDFPTMTAANFNQKMTTGAAGAIAVQLGQGMGTYTTVARQAGNANFQLTHVPYPTVRRGERTSMVFTSFSYSGSASAAIMATSQNVELAARFLDWGYGDDGHILLNFGIEGQSFDWINGYPTFQDHIFNHPEGWSSGQSLAAWALSQGSSAMIQDARYLEQYYELEEQKAATAAIPFPEMFDLMIPPVTPSPDESREFAQIMQAVNTYVQEAEVRWILGLDTLNDTTWRAYVDQINRLGIARAVEIQEAALRRYYNR